MAAEEIEANVLETLAAKVDGLNLSAQEDAVIRAVLARAASADAEVDGFGVVFEVETTFKDPGDLKLTDTAAGWGRALGFHIHVNPGHYIGETEKN